MSQRRIIPVTTLVQYVKQQLDKDIVLHGVLVEGEVSNLRIPSSGHMYFSLKDEKSSIACVMFAGEGTLHCTLPKAELRYSSLP